MAKLKLQGSPEFNAIRIKYTPYELSEFLMKEYITLGSYVQLEMKYKTTKTNIKNHIDKHIDDVNLEKPYIVDLFKHKAKQNKLGKPKRCVVKKKAEVYEKEKLNSNHFKQLPKVVEYRKLIDWVDKNYNTGDMTGVEIIKIAQEQRVKVFEKYKGRPRYLFVEGGTVKWTYWNS